MRSHFSVHLTTDGARTKRLSWMSARWVLRRQSTYSGAAAIAGFAHWPAFGTKSVQSPDDVLAGLLQNRSAFSHRVIPDQLFSSTFREISILSVRALIRGSPPDSDT